VRREERTWGRGKGLAIDREGQNVVVTGYGDATTDAVQLGE